ncbi:MAG: chemotaxis protein CheD [Salinigranum sp.]
MEVYSSDPRPERAERVKVGIADSAVGDAHTTLVTSGLGSCVGIALYDSRAGVAGLVHAMLPRAEDAHGPSTNEAKYVDTGISALLAAMEVEGARVERTDAKLAGGSTMFEFTAGGGNIGGRNVEAAHRTLARVGIDVVAEDVGGSHGRSLELSGRTGELAVRSAAHELQTL